MTSFHSASSVSRREREFPYPRQNRRRKGCSSNKFFTKTGMFLLLGVIILTALPTKGSCRPVEDHVYGLSSSSTSSSHHSLEKEGADDEEAIGSRFEFQRKIVSSSSSTSSDDNNSGSDDDDVHSLELISSNNNNQGASHENSPLSNSSTIVHVIVTSSSSTSSSEVETDSEPEDDTIQYTVEVRNDNEGESSDDSGGTISSSSSSQLSSETLQKQDLSQEQKPSDENHRRNEPDQLELKKLPKFEDDSSSRPVQDIFSAFYSAFTQSSSSPPPTALNEELESSFAQSNDDFNSSVATFSLSQPYFRTRRLPQSFQSFQHRRRQFANRPKKLERKSFSSPHALSGQPFSLSASDKEMEDKQESTGDVEETARKLEFLAKKLDKVEQQNKILEPSPSTVVETSSAVPFLQSSSSTFSTILSPPKVAVSVAVTRSESVAGPRGKKGAASSSAIDQDDERGPTRQRARVAVVVKKNAKNETTLGQEEEKLLSTAHSSTPRLPSRRPKPLIKSLPKYEEDNDDGRINNKNSGNKNNFPRNFSLGQDTGTGSGPFPERGYNHNTRETDVNARVGSNDDEKVKENNFRVLQDRQNIIAFSEDGDEGPNSSSSASVPSAESSSFVEITASRPSRRKITRTVSGQIGDPSTYPFNLPKNNFQLPNRKSAQPRTTTLRPKVVNWQQPEKVWGEPAQVWGLPAEVWGQPERVWSEPAKVWGNTEKTWQKSTQRKQLAEVDIDEMMQSDQPPEDRGPPGEEASTKENEDDMSPQGTFVILGDDETEGDSIDGDLGRPLMLHHFTIPPKPKETVSISTSVSSSVSSNSKKGEENEDKIDEGPVPFSRQVGYFQQPSHSSSPIINAQFTRVNSKNTNSSSFNVNINNSESSSNNSSDPSGKKAGKKFGYVIEGANVRKYRVEERTPDGYIVGEYGVLNNQNAFLRGVRYTADGTINPRLIHEALMKFLSLRR